MEEDHLIPASSGPAAISVLFICLWLAVTLYLGTASYLALKATEDIARTPNSGEYIYRGLTFASAEDAEAFIREQTALKRFPWLFDLPSLAHLMLGVFAAGAMGGLFRVTKPLITKRVPAPPLCLGIPLFAAMTAIVLFALLRLLSWAAVSGDSSMRAEAALGISFLGGVFYERAFEWLEVKAKAIFRKN